MRYGTVSGLWLDRSVTRHLHKKTDRILSGNTPGEDFALLREFHGVDAPQTALENRLCHKLVLADGFASTEEVKQAAVLAMIRADNNLAASGASPLAFRLSLVMGTDCPESVVRREMQEAVRFAERSGWEIAGGNTVFSGPGDQLSITATVVGEMLSLSGFSDSDSTQPENGKLKQDRESENKCKAGDVVIVTGHAGAFGASLLAETLQADPNQPFAQNYLVKITNPGCLSARPAAEVIHACGVNEMKDVSFGGVYRAISEIAARNGFGVTVLNEAIPIRQDTIEICEYLKLNPYELCGTGGLVAVCPEEKLDEVADALRKAGIPYGAAGVLTEEKARKIYSQKSGRERFIDDYRI